MASSDSTARNLTINLRTTPRQRELIDRAADAVGKSRSSFMLEAACREADTVLADRRFFLLDEKAYRQFTAALDKAPSANRRLHRLMATAPPWKE